MNEDGPFFLGLCAIAKDETPFLREWVAYHHLLGFEKVIVYDNGSAVPVRDTLADFYEAGIVDTYTIPGRGLQLTAYNHCLKHHGPQFRWLAFYDLDEFLLLKDTDDARGFLLDYGEYGGVAVNVAAFGSSGHLGRPQGLVIQKYTERLEAAVTTKSIVRPEHVIMPMCPHHFQYREGWYGVNPDRQPVVGASAPLALSRAQINHYPWRSQQDYEDKIRRGDAILDVNPRELEAFYTQARMQTRRETAIARHAPKVEAMLQSGVPQQYCPVRYAAVSRLSLKQVLLLMGEALREGRPERAEVIMAMNWHRFGKEASFVDLGISLALACNRLGRAERLARHLTVIAPALESYARFFSVHLARGEKEEAGAVAAFIRGAAAVNNAEALAATVEAEAREHGIRL